MEWREEMAIKRESVNEIAGHIVKVDSRIVDWKFTYRYVAEEDKTVLSASERDIEAVGVAREAGVATVVRAHG